MPAEHGQNVFLSFCCALLASPLLLASPCSLPIPFAVLALLLTSLLLSIRVVANFTATASSLSFIIWNTHTHAHLSGFYPWFIQCSDACCWHLFNGLLNVQPLAPPPTVPHI